MHQIEYLQHQSEYIKYDDGLNLMGFRYVCICAPHMNLIASLRMMYWLMNDSLLFFSFSSFFCIFFLHSLHFVNTYIADHLVHATHNDLSYSTCIFFMHSFMAHTTSVRVKCAFGAWLMKISPQQSLIT